MALLDLYANPTLSALAEHLEELSGGTLDRSGTLLHRLTPPRIGTPVATVVCLPYSGGQAISFEPLATALPTGWQLYALQCPGRDWSSPDEVALPFDELIDTCLAEIVELAGTDAGIGPIYLYGHCHGSAMTIELARRMTEAGLKPAGVAIGAMFPMARLPGRFFDWIYRHFPVDRLTSDREILAEIRALGGGVAELTDPDELAFVMRAVRHDERGSEEYFARTLSDPQHVALDVPLLSVIGSKDRVTELYTERYQEWEHFSTDVELDVLPKAGHGFLKHQAVELAARLVSWSQRLQARPTTPGAGSRSGRRIVRRSSVQPAAFRRRCHRAVRLHHRHRLSQLVLSLWVYQQSGRITDFAHVTAVALLPGILVGPVAGAVADRYDRRRVMLATDIAAGLALLAVIG